MKRMLVAGALALAAFATSAASAEAALVLRLTEGASSVTIVDNGAGDANPLAGAVTYIGGVGAFSANVSTGFSKPLLPNTPTFGEMDLSSVNLSTGAATLVIELTDTDFLASPTNGKLIGNVGGTSQGILTFDGYKNSSNVEFDIVGADAEVHLGPFDEGAFSGSDSANHGPIGTYSMTLVATITHGSGVNQSSFDFEVLNVPEPASVALFGIGLLGAGVAARRRKAGR